MGGPHGGNKVKERRKKYLAWLRKHPELWDARQEVVVAHMKLAGLLAKSTYAPDVRCIPDLQRQLRSNKRK